MRLALALILVGCGGSPKPAAPAAGGAACTEVADHLVVLAEADNAAPAGPELAAGIRGEALDQCPGWTAERRACLLRAVTQEDTLACPRAMR